MNLFAGDKGSISFNWTGTTEQMAAHIVEKVSRKVVGKFSFPARVRIEAKTGILQ